MSTLETSPATRNAISSPDWAAGHWPVGLLDSLMISLGGAVAARASLSALPGGAKGKRTSATSGQPSPASSASAALQSSSGNKSPLPPKAEISRGKICKDCGTHKPYSAYWTNSKGHTRSCCVECLNAQERYRKTGTKAQRSVTFKTWRKKNIAGTMIAAAKWRAAQKGLPYNLDNWKPQLEERFASGVCEMTGIPFNLDGGRTWDSPSLDRIIPADGYVIQNVRVVIFALNAMMNSWGVETVLDVTDALRRQTEDTLQTKLEKALKKRLSGHGSTESALTWKASVTPLGRPLCRLVPSEHPIGEIACGSSQSALWPTMTASHQNCASLTNEVRQDGTDHRPLADVVRQSLWPTPDASTGGRVQSEEARAAGRKAQVGLANSVTALWATPTSVDGARGLTFRPHDTGTPLPQMVGRALWATPTARDHRSVMASPETHDRNARPLSEQLGGVLFGSEGPTGKPGGLNPQFVSWLMGYPAVWLFTAPTNKAAPRFVGSTELARSRPTVMPSSRKSRLSSSAPTPSLEACLLEIEFTVKLAVLARS